MMMNDHHMSVPQMQEWDLRGICIEPLGNFFVIIFCYTKLLLPTTRLHVQEPQR
jgi:hypothetical protein